MKFIVSFTTSPERIDKIKPMIDSISNQTVKPDLFILNIPEVFPRTGEKYIIPDFVKNNVIVNVVEKDCGPATKIIPTIDYLKKNNYDISDTYIIYLDDDICYLPNMINVYKFLFSLDKSERVLCCGGFQFALFDDKIKIVCKRTHRDIVCVAEGYASVCLPLSIFKDDFHDYIDKYTITNDYPYCKLSDDVILSNYYTSKKIDISIVSMKGKLSILDIWEKKSILDYGNMSDALHCGASGTSVSNVDRYPMVLKTLKENNELSTKVYQGNDDMRKYIYE